MGSNKEISLAQRVSSIATGNAGATAAAGLKSTTGPDAPAVRLTANNIQGLKHDMTVLKQMSELREATSQVSVRPYDGVTAEKKAARKELRKLARAEATHD